MSKKVIQTGIQKHAHLMRKLHNHKIPRDQAERYALKVIEREVVKMGKKNFKIHFCERGKSQFSSFQKKPPESLKKYLEEEGYIVGDLKNIEKKDLDITVEDGQPILIEIDVKCWEMSIELPDVE